MFSYQEFIGNIKKSGVARQNRFEVMISPPAILDATDIQTVLLMCKSVSVPGVTISSTPVRTTGETIEAAYDRTFGAASLTFYVDTDMKIRYFFDEWINSIQSPTTRIFSYPKEYKSPQIEINVLRLDDSPSYTITLFDAFPKSIGDLSLSGDDNNIMTLNVTFDYRYYTTSILKQSRVREVTNQQLVGATSQDYFDKPDVPYDFP